MSQFLEQPGVFDQVIRLGREERQAPLQVLESFFSDYRLHECRHQLWAMIEACLGSESGEFGEPEERSALLRWYGDLEELLEACWLLRK